MTLKFHNLTRPEVRLLKVGERITEHGISAERLINGDVRYSINIMVDGRRIHRVIGRQSEGVTREQAERAIETFRTKAREDRLDLPSGRKNHMLFPIASEEYLRRIEHHPKFGRNLQRKTAHIRQRLAPHFKSQRPDQITDFSIASYVRHRQKDGAAPATINRELSTLSHFLSRCIEWGWARSKPKLSKSEEPRKQIKILGEPSKAALMQAAIKDQDPTTWVFVAIAMQTGMRHGEILRIKWKEIDFDQRRIFIPKAKAGQRDQPIPASLARLLKTEWEQLGKPEGYLFPNSRPDAKSAHRQTMAPQFQRTAQRAGLGTDKVTPHILRHTAITELVKAGVDLPTIQRISGHKTLAMVLRYTQLSDVHVDQAVNKLELMMPCEVSTLFATG